MPGAPTTAPQQGQESLDSAIYCTEPGIETVRAIEPAEIQRPETPAGYDDGLWASPKCEAPSKLPQEITDLAILIRDSIVKVTESVESSPNGKAVLEYWRQCIEESVGVKVSSQLELDSWIASEQDRLFEKTASIVDFELSPG